MARIKKQANGYYCQTFMHEGKQIFVRCKDRNRLAEKVEAKKAELKRQQEQKNILYTDEMTLDQYHEKWENRRQGTVKPATIRNQNMWYQTISETIIDSETNVKFGELKLSQITTATVFDLQNALKNQKQKNGKAKFNTNTINCYINLLKHILQDATNEEIILKNPAKLVDKLIRTEPKARESKHRALTTEETKLFLESAKESFYLNHFRFMLLTGVRCGECGAFKISDVNRRQNRLEIQRTITKAESGNYVIGNSTKSKAGERFIPLSEKIIDVIEAQREIQKALNHDTIRFDSLVFTSPEGCLLNDVSVNREIKRICKQADIEPFTAHALRHTFATRCIENGMNIKTLQEILGHANISETLDTYGHVLNETKETEMLKVVNAINI